MSRRALVVGLILTSCADVPSSVCFSDEPCADGGAPRGGGGGGAQTGGGGAASGGGGALGGGAQSGGGSATGGGAPLGGGFTRSPVVDKSTLLGLLTSWDQVVAQLPPPSVGAPSLAAIGVALPPLTLRSNCTEAFRGALLLPGNRALAIPFCASSFVLIDLLSATAMPVGPLLLGGPSTGPNRGWYAGGVFGCDGRAYVLPFERPAVTRVTPLDDGGLAFDDLPLVGGSRTPPGFLGGVVARDCQGGFRILAGGESGISALDVFEDVIDVSDLGASGTYFGLARIGDDLVMGVTQDPTNTEAIFTRINPETLQVTTSRFQSDFPHLGIATTATQRGVIVNSNATARFLQPDAGVGPVASLSSPSDMRWPTCTFTGWTVAMSDLELGAWRDDGAAPATVGVTAGPSGGLVMTADSSLLSVPGDDAPTALLFIDSNGNLIREGVALSFWFNKL